MQSLCAQEDRFPALNTRSIIDIPAQPIIAEVRLVGSTDDQQIIIKYIEQRYIRKEDTFKEWKQDGKILTSYDLVPYRAANVVRISRSGLCEVRIHSHSEAFDYESEALAQLENLAPLLSKSEFRPFSLAKARKFLCDAAHRKDAREIFELRHTEHFDLGDGRLRTSVGGLSSSMLDNKAVTDAIDAFQKSESTVHRAGFSLKECREIQRRININLSGGDNEFFMSAKVTRSEYEYALHQILACSKKMSA